MTGPWRSAPRDEGAAPGHRPGTAAETAGTDPHARRGPAAAEGGRRGALLAWIVLGTVAAVAIVAAAVAFKVTRSQEPAGLEAAAPTVEVPVEVPVEAPAVASPAPLPRPSDAAAGARLATAAPTALPSGGEAAAPVAPADPALAGVTVVRLRIGPDFPAERQAAILAALAGAGITGVRVEPLPFEIATSRVGYYRAEDLPAAQALGRVVAPVIAAGGEVGVRDYGELLADATPGRLDLWIGE
ncbi:MAG TPA: hypothetical protein VFN28_13735 [Amaricoccus sp.]|nr:hypothetical protein [Amaricoccus sp.]